MQADGVKVEGTQRISREDHFIFGAKEKLDTTFDAHR